MPTAPADRNLSTELQGILQQLGGFNQANYNTALQYNGALTQNNLANYQNALRGQFNATAFDAANPGFLNDFQQAQANGQLQGWTPAQYAAAVRGVGENDPSLTQYYTNGIGTNIRQAYDQANPALASFTSQFGNTVNSLNAQGPASYSASGYQASGSGNQAPVATSLAAFNPFGATATTANQQTANAVTARQQMANGGPLLGALNQSAAYNLDRVSPLQAQQQAIASNLLGAGGGLTQGELQNAQDSARAAYSDRGLVRSNRGIGAEILQTDAAQRNRLMSNLGIAQGVDAAGQSQLGQNRSYALGVQGQGQNLSTFNAGQGNSLGQFNAGLLTNNSQFNAGQGNALGQFNAGLLTNNSQFNAGQFNNVGLNLANSNADRLNQMGQFNAQLGQQNNQFNATQLNNAAQFNSGASNTANAFNAGLAQQNQNDIYNRSAGYGGFLLGQAQNPSNVALGLMGQAPDYTQGLLGYGSDLNNTNYNAAYTNYINSVNRSAATNNGILGMVGSIAGGALGGPLGGVLGNAVGSLFGGSKATCWVAREVYGVDNPKWLAFRYWLMEFAPLELRDAYMAGGEELAKVIREHPEMKESIRAFMDEKINSL